MLLVTKTFGMIFGVAVGMLAASLGAFSNGVNCKVFGRICSLNFESFLAQMGFIPCINSSANSVQKGTEFFSLRNILGQGACP